MSSENLGNAVVDTNETKVEVDMPGKALADRFSKLDTKTQAKVLENIGLEKIEEPSDKERFKSLPKEEQEKFKEETGTKNIGLIKSAGKAFTNLAGKIESRIETIMDDPGKRALFYAGLDAVDRSSRIRPISEAQSLFGILGGSLKKGVQTVKGEELAQANVEARGKISSLKNLLEQSKLAYEMSKETPAEIKRYENIYEQNKDAAKGLKNYENYKQMSKIYSNFITEKGSLPVGVLRSQLPVMVQAVSEILPVGMRKDVKFFENMSDEASFIKNLNKFTNDIVLGDISQLVPVSDKDVEIKRSTLPSASDSAKVLTYSLRTQGAISLLNGLKYDYIDTYRNNKGLRSGKTFDKTWRTEGSTSARDQLLDNNQFTADQIVTEAKKLGFQPDYDQYTDGKPFYSPLALAEATMSLQMGGLDKYQNVGVSAIEPSSQTVIKDTNTNTTNSYNPNQFKKDADELRQKLK